MGVSTEREKTLNQVQTPRQDEVNRSGLALPGRLGETDTAVVGFTSPEAIFYFSYPSDSRVQPPCPPDVRGPVSLGNAEIRGRQ